MSYPAAHRLQDVEGRLLRARRIQRILEEFGDIRLAGARVLDLGASHLLIARGLAQCGADVVGVDVDHRALAHGMAEAEANPGLWLCAVAGSGMSLPFADSVFDVVVCNHVYEHVPNPDTLVVEIKRVLREGGVCYFAGGHKYQIMEPHYRLPFLSWLPKRWSGGWLRWARLADHYDIQFLTQPKLRQLLGVFDNARNLTPDLLARASEFRIGAGWLQTLVARLPRRLLAVLARLSPTHLWLLTK